MGCGSPEYDGESALALVGRQCEFGPRVPGTPGHEAMLEWMVAELGALADEVSVQRFTVLGEGGTEVELANVIASFRLDARERVLLGAHWDTRGIAERDPDPANAEKITDWTKAYWEATHPHSAGGAYVNFMMDDEGQERVQATYQHNYQRLAEIKKKYDPRNLFRVNQNIQPAD